MVPWPEKTKNQSKVILMIFFGLLRRYIVTIYKIDKFATYAISKKKLDHFQIWLVTLLVKHFQFFSFFELRNQIQLSQMHLKCSIWHTDHFGISDLRFHPQKRKLWPNTWSGTVSHIGSSVSVTKKREWILNISRILRW